jgi:hypothetical protein
MRKKVKVLIQNIEVIKTNKNYLISLFYSAGGSGIHRALNQPTKQQTRPGDAYKTKV